MIYVGGKMEKIDIPNKAAASAAKCKISYSAASDKYTFDINLSPGSKREFALLFYKRDGSRYTADIIKGKNAGGKTEVAVDKIDNAVKISLVDIESEEEIFASDFSLKPASRGPGQKVAALEAVPEDIKTQEEPDREPVQEETNVKAGQKEQSESDLLKEILDSFMLAPDSDSAVDEDESEIQIDFIDNSPSKTHTIGFSPYTEESPRVKKGRNNYILINDTPDVLEDLFEVFSDFENEMKNRVFYALNEKISEDNELRVLLNGYNVTLSTPFLEYKNSYTKQTKYPERLIGKLVSDNEAQYFIFAVLGKNTSEEQPFMGSTGFVYYEQIKNSDLGYWMSYINAKTGKISLPIKPKKYDE